MLTGWGSEEKKAIFLGFPSSNSEKPFAVKPGTVRFLRSNTWTPTVTKLTSTRSVSVSVSWFLMLWFVACVARRRRGVMDRASCLTFHTAGGDQSQGKMASIRLPLCRKRINFLQGWPNACSDENIAPNFESHGILAQPVGAAQRVSSGAHQILISAEVGGHIEGLNQRPSRSVPSPQRLPKRGKRGEGSGHAQVVSANP